jgi:hypothetical protein
VHRGLMCKPPFSSHCLHHSTFESLSSASLSLLLAMFRGRRPLIALLPSFPLLYFLYCGVGLGLLGWSSG